MSRKWTWTKCALVGRVAIVDDATFCDIFKDNLRITNGLGSRRNPPLLFTFWLNYSKILPKLLPSHQEVPRRNRRNRCENSNVFKLGVFIGIAKKKLLLLRKTKKVLHQELDWRTVNRVQWYKRKRLYTFFFWYKVYRKTGTFRRGHTNTAYAGFGKFTGWLGHRGDAIHRRRPAMVSGQWWPTAGWSAGLSSGKYPLLSASGIERVHERKAFFADSSYTLPERRFPD